MSRTRTQALISKIPRRQTNKDRPRRYRLSLSGLQSLRTIALRNKPWLLSSGPKTVAGKARSKLNTTKHGERSAKSRATWRELNAAIRALAQRHREECDTLDGILPAGPDTLGEAWVERIADELRVTII